MASSNLPPGATQLPDGEWLRVKSVFLQALDLAEPERALFVANVCAGEEAVEREVLSLLQSDKAAGSFCERPAATLLRPGADRPPLRLEPGTRLGAYEITGFIGAGGMGEVYRARDVRLRREVAIKTVPAEALEGRAALRLLKEARHVSSLSHPNICTIHEIGESAGIPFVVMELVDGRTLSDLQRDAKLPLEEALRYAIQIADALAHAHGRGIVHRDLKSSNVIIDRAGRPIVLDFGLAMRLPLPDHTTASRSATHQGPAGTLTHMAPEVLLGGRGDERSDIWAMGVLLYQLVDGQLPFSGRTAFETSSAILNAPAKPMDRRVPLALRMVIERCLAKKPDERYRRVSDVRAALEGVLARGAWRIAARLMMPSRRKGLQITAAAAVAALTLYLGAAQLRQAPVVPVASFRTLAVLPLDNGDTDASNEFYASGITDALIAQLGAAVDLRVISRTSAIHANSAGKSMAAIGRELGADAIVQGTVRRSADRVRLDLRLSDSASGHILWSDTFERSARDILVLQADAVRAVVAGVRAALRPEARERLTIVPVIRPDVYEAYLKGRYEWNRRTAASLQLAIEYFGRAIALDPAYAPAHAALADCYNQLGTVMVGTGSPRAHRPRAAAEAIKALQIDPGSSEAHAALGYVRHYEWQWAEAEQAFLRAIDLNPSNTLARLWYANLLMSRRRFDEALRQAYAARDLDPFSLIVNTNIGWILAFAGRHGEAVEHLIRTVALDPEYPQARWRLADALAMSGRYDEALVQANEAIRLANRSPSTLSMLALVYSRMGRTAQARTILRELLETARHQYVPPSAIGGVYGALGEDETALEWLERSYEEGSNFVAYMSVEPSQQRLRAHPRFQAILQRTGQH
jgi:TolB-like protein/Flp pilus assembly protein TadD